MYTDMYECVYVYTIYTFIREIIYQWRWIAWLCLYVYMCVCIYDSIILSLGLLTRDEGNLTMCIHVYVYALLEHPWGFREWFIMLDSLSWDPYLYCTFYLLKYYHIPMLHTVHIYVHTLILICLYTWPVQCFQLREATFCISRLV